MLLLTTLEGFSPAERPRFVDRTYTEIQELLAAAVAEIDRQIATRVLIIEDEPLIAIDLVGDRREPRPRGHRHRRHRRAGGAAPPSAERPGLVLADIQLADGSSGLDAVQDILAMFEVPVIFITAFPERLLTGERPEPTFLITKPFHPERVKAAIGQALFFRTTASLDA